MNKPVSFIAYHGSVEDNLELEPNKAFYLCASYKLAKEFAYREVYRDGLYEGDVPMIYKFKGTFKNPYYMTEEEYDEEGQDSNIDFQKWVDMGVDGIVIPNRQTYYVVIDPSTIRLIGKKYLPFDEESLERTDDRINDKDDIIGENVEYKDEVEVLINPTYNEFKHFMKPNGWYRMCLTNDKVIVWDANTSILHQDVDNEYGLENSEHIFIHKGKPYLQDYDLDDYLENEMDSILFVAKQIDNNPMFKRYFPNHRMEVDIHKAIDNDGKYIVEEYEGLNRLDGFYWFDEKKFHLQLNEGIEDVKRYFPKITNEDFTKLINLDPTYKGGNELGKYGKWILGLYNTFLKDKESYAKWEEQKKLGNNFPEPTRKSQEQIEDFDKIHAILKDFDVMNTKLKVNINNVKSVAELYKIVNDAKNEGISNNSKVNHVIDLVKKSVEKGGEVVFKDSNWVVLIPKTLESSVVFGSDTNWCTTASNGERYEYYKKEYGGEYYINVNLKDGSLYQFHFESEQFMDKNDDPIRILDFLNGNMSLFSFYKKHFGSSLIGKTTCGIMFVDNPSEEMQLEAVKQNWYAIVYIKNPSEAVQLEAVKKHGSVIQYIKNPSEAVQLIAVKKNGHGIKYITNPSEAVQLIAVGQFSDTIKYITNPSEAVQLAAVKENGYSIRYIKNPSEQVQMKAVEYIADVIKYIKNPSEAVQLAAVKANKKALNYIENPTPDVIKVAQKRKRKSSSSMNESAGSKDSLDFYKRFEGTEVEAKDDGEVFTIVDVEHDGFGIRFKLESNESDMQIIMELDEMDKYFTGFKPFEKDEKEWDGEDDEDKLMETVHQAKFKKGQKLIHKSSGEEWTVRHIHYEHGLGFFYEIVRPLQLSNGEMATIKYNESEKSLEKGYENMDYPDDTENEDYWDGE